MVQPPAERGVSGERPREGRSQRPYNGPWVIVTTETTTGQGSYTGLPPTVHVTYATLTHRAGGWVISQWSPQS